MVDLAKVHICHQRALKRLQLRAHIGFDLNTPSLEASISFQSWIKTRGFADSTCIFLALCLSLSSPSVILQTQEGPSLVSVAVRHMLCPNPSCVCCRYGGSPRQITDVVGEVTRRHSTGGWEGRCLWWYTPGTASASWPVPGLFDGYRAGPWDPKLRAGGRGRKRQALPTGPVI